MGMLEKALAGAGQAVTQIGLEELKNQSYMKRQDRLNELTGAREEKAYQRELAGSAAASEAALAKEQRGYEHAEKIKRMDIAGKKSGKRQEVTFVRPSDKKEFSQSELVEQYETENKIPKIDSVQFTMMDTDAQNRLLRDLAQKEPFAEWVKRFHGIDITGGYKPEASSEKAAGSGTMPWSQGQTTSSYKSLWSE